MERTVKIKVLGGGQEVGRNCFVLTYPTGERILLDCGLKASNGQVAKTTKDRYPLKIKRLRDIDLAFVSHPHLDHVGALPLAFRFGLRCPVVIANNIAKEVSEVILKDSLDLEKRFFKDVEYYVGWVNYALNKMRVEKSGQCGNVSYELIPTSHIPGGVSILLKHPETRSLLYTGDIRMSETLLMKGRTILPQADVMFSDCTYGDELHPDRKKTELEFEKIVLDSLQKGGQVLIPCLSVARIQEILLLISRFRQKFSVPVYLDGMGRKITGIYLKYANELDNPSLIEAVKNVNFISGKFERLGLSNEPAIIVPSGGMVNSPLVHFYLRNIAADVNSVLILTSYQAERTGGRELLETGKITMEKGTPKEQILEPKCQVIQLPFSAHADSGETEDLIKLVDPWKVLAIHGEADGIKGVKKIAKRLKIKCRAPRNGDILYV